MPNVSPMPRPLVRRSGDIQRTEAITAVLDELRDSRLTDSQRRLVDELAHHLECLAVGLPQ